ncbi:CoA-binding protein [Risungbinella massiliensis]|uniref:CoA-binding protein n=1 Tax=Risungbinella massiliensis TaxID=1329796 RepID=UPI0005CB8F7C|nr:CoA-binding protein [Risungbinella massiliensis]
MSSNPSNETIISLLEQAKTIAVVGLSDKPDRTSYQIAEAMQQAGYRIIPVNPNLRGPVLGETSYATLQEIPDTIDIVNIFRRSDSVPPVIDEVVQMSSKPKAVWMQLGIAHDEAAKRALDHGIEFVIMDRCIKVDHAVLLKGKKRNS